MNHIPDLPRLITTLARIDEAGWLEDFRLEVAEASRGPKEDLDRYPQWRFQVGKFARLASTLFGISVGEAHDAACQALLPSTRRRVAIEVLEQFDQRLDEQALRDAVERKLSAVSRRRVRA